MRSGIFVDACGKQAAHWASWAEKFKDDPSLASRSGGHQDHTICPSPTTFGISSALQPVVRSSALWGMQHPTGRSLATALPRRLAVRLPGVLGIPDEGWQDDASSIVERYFLDSSVWPLLGSSERAMLRSQGGPLSGLPFMALPVTPLSRFDSDLFRVLLLRRLRLPLPVVFSLLPVWPSSRLPWPSPRKLLEGRGAWEICSCPGVPRSRSTSLNERLLA